MSNALYQNSETYLKRLLKDRLPTGSRFFLFGSRAQGTAGFAADIDIGIWPQDPLNDTTLSDLQDLANLCIILRMYLITIVTQMML